MSPVEVSPNLARLGIGFYERPVLAVAPELLNKILVVSGGSGLPGMSGRIVETEAYTGADDPASHSYRGRTKRNEVMFGPAGRLYVYFTYGMHWCANVVCGSVDEGVAVLIRALEPIDGRDLMRSRRAAARRERDLCNGPAKLCQALAIDGLHNGVDLTARRAPVWIGDDDMPPPVSPEVGPRVGISVAKELSYRWCVPYDEPGGECVSRPRSATNASSAAVGMPRL